MKKEAFTLTELLVAMAVFSGLILLLFSVVDQTTTAWRQSEQRVDAFREARAALFVIGRDLQSFIKAHDVAPADGVADFGYFFVNPDGSGNTDVTFSGVASNAEGDRLFFLTAQPGGAQNNARGEICSVGYYLNYSTPPANAMTGAGNYFTLHRYFRNSDATFGPLQNYIAGSSSILMNAASTADEVLARNVVDFRVRPYRADGTSPSPWDTRETPAFIELSLTAYNYSVATRLARNEWMRPPAGALASRQVFHTRVAVPRR
jgi:prepilin-type N-terminal cleavage/methylation domain-containing protein